MSELSRSSKLFRLSESKQKYFKLAMSVGAGIACIGIVTYANAAGKAVHVDVVDNLAATFKEAINGPASYLVDVMIIAGAGWGAAIMRSPAPLIFGLISCGIFHVAIKLLG